MSQGASVLAQQVLAEVRALPRSLPFLRLTFHTSLAQIPNQAVQYLEFHHVVPNKA